MCPRVFGPTSSRPFKQVMVFIDGGYLRELCKKTYGHDRIDFRKLQERIVYWFNNIVGKIYPFQADLIRIYYYDAIVDEKHSDFKAQRKYFDSIRNVMLYTVKLGELVESTRQRLKQKGVDILIAIDALTMAYRNLYEVGMFLMGDRDFVPLIEAVKNAGKKTVGVYYKQSTAQEFVRSCDIRVSMSKKRIADFLK